MRYTGDLWPILSMPVNSVIYACRPCEVFWANEPACFICNDKGTVVSDAVVRKEHLLQ